MFYELVYRLLLGFHQERVDRILNNLRGDISEISDSESLKILLEKAIAFSILNKVDKSGLVGTRNVLKKAVFGVKFLVVILLQNGVIDRTSRF